MHSFIVYYAYQNEAAEAIAQGLIDIGENKTKDTGTCKADSPGTFRDNPEEKAVPLPRCRREETCYMDIRLYRSRKDKPHRKLA